VGHAQGSPLVIDRENSGGSATAMGINGSAKRRTSQEPPRLSTALTPEDNDMLVRNVAEVAAAAATLAIHNSQVESANPTPQTTPRPPPLQTGPFQPSVPFPAGPYLKRTPEHRASTHDWDHADLAEVGMGGGHDAPNWSRTKSSMILLGATILYAVIAGMTSFCGVDVRNFGGYC
jgi:Ca2+:H+ antiporter